VRRRRGRLEMGRMTTTDFMLPDRHSRV